MDVPRAEIMPRDAAAYVSSLLRDASIEDHEEILKASTIAIKANKSDVLAKRTKLVALLKLDRFDDAVQFIAKSGVDLEPKCILEKAYALYKTGQLNEASAMLRKADRQEHSLQHVAAQVAYRAERFAEAGQIYTDMLNKIPVEEENDFKINMKAVQAQAEWNGLLTPCESLHGMPESFELCYNDACSKVARGTLGDASQLLQRAAMLCKSSEDLDEEDKQTELRSIWLQQAYTYAREDKVNEALELFKSLGSLRNDDADFVIIARQNRLLVEAKHKNPYLRYRQMNVGDDKVGNAKLFSYQLHRKRQNARLLDLDVHKVKSVQEKTRALLEEFKLPTISAGVNATASINATAFTYGLDDKTSLRKMQVLLAKRPLDVGLLLTVIQLQLHIHDKKGAALFLLKSFLQRLEREGSDESTDVRFSPGLVALVVSLMRAQGHKNSAKAEFASAVKHWTKRISKPSISLLQEAGIELMRSSNPDHMKLAGLAFDKLSTEHEGSRIASAGHVASLAGLDADEARQHGSEIATVDSLTKGINVKSLLQAGVVATPSGHFSIGCKKRAVADDAVAAADNKPAAKRRRRRRLPKHYEEGRTPDPERWLPLRDRSSYRPKNKKGKKKAVDLTQGGVVKEEETLGLVGGGGVKVEKSGGPTKKKKGKR